MGRAASFAWLQAVGTLPASSPALHGGARSHCPAPASWQAHASGGGLGLLAFSSSKTGWTQPSGSVRSLTEHQIPLVFAHMAT